MEETELTKAETTKAEIPQAEIPRAMHEQHMALEQLDKITEQLGERIKSILRNEPPEEQISKKLKDVNETRSYVQMVNEIVDKTNTIKRITNRLEAFYNLCEC